MPHQAADHNIQAMQLTLFYADGMPRTKFFALETLDPREENMADDDDEAFDDFMQDEDDLQELRTNDNSREVDPEDDDHLPEEG